MRKFFCRTVSNIEAKTLFQEIEANKDTDYSHEGTLILQHFFSEQIKITDRIFYIKTNNNKNVYLRY
jgi:hypothetical protein